MKTLARLSVSSILTLLALIPYSGRSQTLLHQLETSTPKLNGAFGISVSGVPDLTGDGIQDVLVGASGEDNGGHIHVFNGATGVELYFAEPQPNRGTFGNIPTVGTPDLDGDGKGDFASFVIETPSLEDLVEVHSGATGEWLYTLESPRSPSGGFGWGLAALDDLDGDGAGDLLVGAPDQMAGNMRKVGRAYLVSGAAGVVLDKFTPAVKEADSEFGFATAQVPDADGDGVKDLAVGAPGQSSGHRRAGHAYLYSGATGALLHEMISPNRIRTGNFGFAIAGLNDINGDGFGDIAVGAPNEMVDGLDLAGRVHIFSGATGQVLHTLVSPEPELQDFFGKSLARLADVDGDGRDDLLIGSPNRGLFKTHGECFVFNAATGTLRYRFSSPSIDEFDDDSFGRSVAGLEDVDGDGYGDFVVGGLGEERAYIFSGAVNTP